MNRTAIAIIAAIFACSTAAAQEATILHELSVNAGGGFFGLKTSPTLNNSDSKGKGTFTFGLGYNYALNQQLSIGTGINFALYSGNMSINNYDQQQTAINTNIIEAGREFSFIITSPDYNEKKLRSAMITIPLMAQYRYYGFEQTVLYGALGFKIGIPVSSKVNKSEGLFTTKGYYPEWGITYEDLPEYGFVTDQPFPEETKISMKAAIMASLEVGARLPIENTNLYAGIYADIGLNKTLKSKTTSDIRNLVVFQADAPSQFLYNVAADSYSKRLAPYALGVNVRWVFDATTLFNIKAQSDGQ